MKPYPIVVLMMIGLMLSACSGGGKEYDFYGKSTNWIVKYETEISKEREWADYSIEYIGKDPAPSMLGYNIESSWFEFGSKQERFKHRGKNVISGNSECTGPPTNNKSCQAMIEEDEQIKAKIEWNGNSEVIILNRN